MEYGHDHPTRHILVVDDESDIRSLLTEILSEEGYEVDAAANASEARASRASRVPDLVLLDAMMPGMTGFDVCEAVRADAALRGTTILMLTAKGRETDVARGVGAGADAYMTKPFSTRELVAKVKSLLDIPA